MPALLFAIASALLRAAYHCTRVLERHPEPPGAKNTELFAMSSHKHQAASTFFAGTLRRRLCLNARSAILFSALKPVFGHDDEVDFNTAINAVFKLL
ncbi:MAG: hypothetical protein E5W82_30110, partial [Mesorhizobium sp.]